MAPLKAPAKYYGGASTKKYQQYIKPMMAKLHDGAFDDPQWIYEIKWDGYRAIADKKGDELRLYSRNGLSFNEDYAPIYDELAKKLRRNIVLDGEIVALDEDGKPRFQLLQQYGQERNVPICYYVFDCLYLDGKSLENKPLLERKEILKKVLPKSDIVLYCDHVEERGKDFFEVAKKQGLEGVIAKKADSVYTEGERTSQWLKLKNIVMEEAVIAGYTAPGGSRSYFGALVLGIYKGGKLVYIGHTGTGFDDKTLKEVYRKLQPLKTTESPFDTVVAVNAPVTWVKPQLVCNLKYSEVTQGGTRRHPVFMGLREDKDATDVHEEVKDTTDDTSTTVHKKTAMEATKSIGGKKVALTHLDKIFWPDEGYTKGDVIDYYNDIFPYIGRYMKDRPESLMRTPNGIKDKGFFHKDAGLAAPEWVKHEALISGSSGKEVNYIICNDKPTLLYLANLGCIEMNPWNSRLGHLDNPDYLILDLDPSENNTFDQVVETAKAVKEVLDRAGAACYPKTSGATGIHIYVPLGARYTYDQARDFAHIIAASAHDLVPDFTSLERSLAKRSKDHIYIDYLQNSRGQTLACAYSLRPKPGAPVSTPLEWRELKKGLHPADFNIRNIRSRVDKKGDLFRGVLLKGIDMAKCISKLEK